MRLQYSLVATVVAVAAMSASPAANANLNPVHYTDQGAFEALGAIDQLTNFDNFIGPAIFNEPPPLTMGMLTVNSAQNYVVTPGTGSTNTRNLLSEHYPGLPGTPDTLTFTITQPGENLFAFKFGDLNFPGSASFVIHTNKGFYEYGMDDPLASNLAFNGVLAPTGEYFTGFDLFGNSQGNNVPAIYDNMPGVTDIEIGHTADIPSTLPGGGVPEPAAWTLMILGFGAVGAAIRRRKPAFA